MRNRHRLYRVLLLLLPASLTAQELPFATRTVAPQVIAVERRFDGTVEAVQQATVSSQVAGRIEAVLFDVDDFVQAGDVLVRFRNPEQQAEVNRAQANLREAEARASEATAERARIQKVFAQNLVSRSAMDKADAEYKAAQARLKAAQAAITQAQEQLEHTLVRAPYSGIVTQRHVEAGETATVGQPLMSGLSLNRLRVTTQVPQTYIDPIRQLASARVELPGTEPVESTDVTVFPYAEPGSHSFRVRVNLPEGLGGLYPGMLLKVAFRVAETEQLLVPTSAVVARSELTGVYVVTEDGRLQFRQLRLGETRGADTAVLAGLEAGDTIALDPIAAGIFLKQQRAQP